MNTARRGAHEPIVLGSMMMKTNWRSIVCTVLLDQPGLTTKVMKNVLYPESLDHIPLLLLYHQNTMDLRLSLISLPSR